jgi:hypothetical protein
MDRQSLAYSLRILQKSIGALQAEIKGLRFQVRTLIELHRTVPHFAPDAMTIFILSLPQHLQRTWRALLTLGRATAPQIATVTQRARAMESSYLNQLFRMNALYKEKVERVYYFSIKGELLTPTKKGKT